jgi:hypothetical protein
MMSLSAFVIPVLLDTNSNADHMVRQWVRLYHYGHIYLPALCITTCGLYAYAAWYHKVTKSVYWATYALAVVSTIAMVPFTWLIMAPTNDTLFQLDASDEAVNLASAQGLLKKWAWLHATRSLSPLVGSYLGFTNILRELGSQAQRKTK